MKLRDKRRNMKCDLQQQIVLSCNKNKRNNSSSKFNFITDYRWETETICEW